MGRLRPARLRRISACITICPVACSKESYSTHDEFEALTGSSGARGTPTRDRALIGRPGRSRRAPSPPVGDWRGITFRRHFRRHNSRTASVMLLGRFLRLHAPSLRHVHIQPLPAAVGAHYGMYKVANSPSQAIAQRTSALPIIARLSSCSAAYPKPRAILSKLSRSSPIGHDQRALSARIRERRTKF